VSASLVRERRSPAPVGILRNIGDSRARHAEARVGPGVASELKQPNSSRTTHRDRQPVPRGGVSVTTDRIDIICEDPHHARAKVAKIQSFVYYADTDSWVAIPHRSQGRAHQHPGEPPTPWRPNVVGARAPLRHRFECKLCAGRPWGAPLECTDRTLKWLLNTVAAQDVTRISIHTLNVIASKKPKQ
jgi:hypothetical protein